MPYALCPMPYALCQIVPPVTEKGYICNNPLIIYEQFLGAIPRWVPFAGVDTGYYPREIVRADGFV
jgi:hypothetical protein